MATSTWPAASFRLFLLVPLLLLLSSAAAHDHGQGQGPRQPPSTPHPKVKPLCDAAPYKDPCYQSMPVLSPLAGNGAADLARAALGLGLDSAKGASKHLSGPAAQSEPLLSCARAMSGVVDLLQQAMGQLDSLAQPAQGVQDVGPFVGKALGWANKAVADANGCLQSLQNTPAGSDPIYNEVAQAMQLTSNALGFVSAIAPHQNL